MAEVKGVVVVMSTPMDKKSNIDEEGIHTTINFLIDKGVGGLWLLGSQGEDINITVDQRMQVIRAAA